MQRHGDAESSGKSETGERGIRVCTAADHTGDGDVEFMMRVTYLSHSGFLVEMDDACFLFDYYKGEIPDIDREKQLFVFVSHGHYDHYKKEIFRLAEREKETYYILPEEIKIPKEPKVKLSEDRLILTVPGGEYEAAGCKIRTLRSTDEGVAYLVSYRGKRIYHAGDLNWWHWEEEEEPFNRMMRRNYQREIDKLNHMEIDAAFVPVDPRLGEQYCWGLDYFMRQTRTKNVFPMHFWGEYEIFDRLDSEACTEAYRERMIRIEREGQIFDLER